MPIDIYNKEFQNWLKGVFGLKATKTALLEYLSDKVNDIVKDINLSELAQFFKCLESNGIDRLKVCKKSAIQWGCKHESCKDLMGHFVHNHTKRGVLNYKWRSENVNIDNIDNTVSDNEIIDIQWNIIKLFMYIEKDEAAGNYTNLDCLDISHLIKIIRNCKLFYPDGSAESCEEVRNKYVDINLSKKY